MAGPGQGSSEEKDAVKVIAPARRCCSGDLSPELALLLPAGGGNGKHGDLLCVWRRTPSGLWPSVRLWRANAPCMESTSVGDPQRVVLSRGVHGLP
jgi:hypothetical protein